MATFEMKFEIISFMECATSINLPMEHTKSILEYYEGTDYKYRLKLALADRYLSHRKVEPDPVLDNIVALLEESSWIV